jgi:type II secretory pathway pseudopilin PulG
VVRRAKRLMGSCMPIGDLQARRGGGAGAQLRGFTYILLLFVLAIGGAALAALGEQWLHLAQRERETELLFRGAQIQQALASFRDATPRAAPGASSLANAAQTRLANAPLALQDLLVDARSDPPRYHLRRLYADPFTQQADWRLVLDDSGRIRGVASTSRQPAQRRPELPLLPGADPQAPAVGDWLFEINSQEQSTSGSGPQ